MYAWEAIEQSLTFIEEHLTLPWTMALQAMQILRGLSRKRMESHPKGTGGICQCLTHLTSRKFP